MKNHVEVSTLVLSTDDLIKIDAGSSVLAAIGPLVIVLVGQAATEIVK